LSEVPKPTDMLGNLIFKDCLVTFQTDRPLVFKVIAIELGGLHTTSGITPAVIRLATDITLRKLPGQPFASLVRIVTPAEEEIADKIASIIT
jgi:hypothetical protein